MLVIAVVLLFLGIVKKFEPLLLVPIAFGMLVTNLPGAEMFHEILFAGGHVHWDLFGGEPITASSSRKCWQRRICRYAPALRRVPMMAQVAPRLDPGHAGHQLTVGREQYAVTAAYPQ